MVKPLYRRPIVIIILPLLLVMAIALGDIVRSSIASPLNQITPPDLPTLPTNLSANGNTSTPNATDISINKTEYAKYPHPTPTALVISKKTDLSPELPEDDKYVIVVAHPDGTSEQFTVGPVSISTDPFGVRTPYIISMLNLKQGDKIVLAYAIVVMKTRLSAYPPTRPVSTTAPPIPTSSPYPPPVVETPAPTILPYPIPPTQASSP